MNAPCICPACGQDLPEFPRLAFQYNNVLFGKGCARATGQTRIILRLLSEAWPDTVSIDRIMIGLFSDPDHEPLAIPREVVCQRVVLARKQIKPLGLTIANEWGEGYRLVYPEAA